MKGHAVFFFPKYCKCTVFHSVPTREKRKSMKQQTVKTSNFERLEFSKPKPGVSNLLVLLLVFLLKVEILDKENNKYF